LPQDRRGWRVRDRPVVWAGGLQSRVKYVFLAYQGEKLWEAVPTWERSTLVSACLANEQDLWQSGHLLAAAGLESSRSAITVKIVSGLASLTEGAYAVATGQLLRIFFIDARDLNEAILVASRMPQARRGPIEIRPVATG